MSDDITERAARSRATAASDDSDRTPMCRAPRGVPGDRVSARWSP
ncbi:MAG: hypothetical protein ABEI57_03455 [Halapricum sp.]